MPESTKLDLGLTIPSFPQFGAPDPALVRDTARHAEACGFSRLWCFDHILWYRPFLDALTATTIALEATEHVAVGPGVLQALLRPPAVLAASLGSLVDLAGDRLSWGLGVGEHQREYDAAERPIPPAQRWGAMIHHHQEVTRALEAAGRTAPRPWIGGRGAGALNAISALDADWLPAFLGPSQFAERLDRLAELGAVPARRGPVIICCPPQHLEAGRRWFESLYDMAPGIGRSIVLPADTRLTERVAQFVEAGANHVSFAVAMDDPRDHLEALRELMSSVTVPSPRSSGGSGGV